MDEYIRKNLELWNKLAKPHYKSEFYDVEGFLRGNQTLDPIEIEELPNLTGKKVLHLMCHFGLDTLSLARLGATATGVDFSSEAIQLARELSEIAKIDATFVCSNIYDLPQKLRGTFDIVFTSGGVLVWLPDLEKWARIMSEFLKPGGIFYIRDFHPFASIFDNEDSAKDLQVKYPYFQGREPLKFEFEGSYASGDASIGINPSYEWNHSISEIFNVLIDAGLTIEFFHEFPITRFKAFPFMVEKEPGMWVLPEDEDLIPLMFSLKATKHV
ncbi:MAG: class I SAM-dependent methyltransferase [Candidatus Thorarchaeota archaeon]